MLPLESIYRGRTLNLAHRGAREVAPENTLPAFERALALGADGFELDVQMTFDDVPVVSHNFKIDETTDGEGYITEYTLEQLQAFDAGAYFDPAFAGTRIPSLAEVLEAFPETFINIEIKSLNIEDMGAERAVVEVVRAHDAAARVLVSSFNPFSLRRLRKLAPELPAGLLVAGAQPFLFRKGWLMFGAPYQALHPSQDMVDAALVASTHKKGRRVNTWTVNDPDDMARLLALGVDAIMTDRPDLLKSVMEEQD